MTRWEYWPFNVLYFPVFFYFTYLIIKSRSFFFFSASNPSIDFGGMLGESKKEIFDIIPDEYIPKTKMFSAGCSIAEIKSFLEQSKLSFPIICKPDVGERGWMVEKVLDMNGLERYLKTIKVDFLVQAYVDYPLELGVFYYRFPSQDKGIVSSIVMKDLLHVVGDGKKNIEELLNNNPRAKMHLDSVKNSIDVDLKNIPLKGDRLELEPIGNHCKGTTFLNGNKYMSRELTDMFDQISKRIPGFYFGRFDLRCESIEKLEKGEKFKILELNGSGAEPGHIYQPGYPLLKAYKDICFHLNVLCQISVENKKRGYSFMTFKEGIKKIKEIRKYNKQKG